MRRKLEQSTADSGIPPEIVQQLARNGHIERERPACQSLRLAGLLMPIALGLAWAVGALTGWAITGWWGCGE